MTYKLLFVCLGNICRSPAAENIMNNLIQEKGLEDVICCDSAGTSNYHLGYPPDQRMLATLKNRNLPTQGQARQFEVSDFTKFDLILAMDFNNYQSILSLDLQERYQHKVKLICDFATQHSFKEVPDPYFGGIDGFDTVVDLLQDSCQGLLKYVLTLTTVS